MTWISCDNWKDTQKHTEETYEQACNVYHNVCPASRLVFTPVPHVSVVKQYNTVQCSLFKSHAITARQM